MINSFISSVIRPATMLLPLVWCVVTASATPYASGVTNSGGTITFFLNESADSVEVVFNNGASTNNLGALVRGRHSFGLGANNSFRIVARKNSPPGYNAGAPLQISDDSTLFRFNAPRGVAVNRNPDSPYFGRIYVANSVAGTTTVSTNAVARTLTDGIYLLNPDFSDALEQGTNALTGGIAFDTSGTPGAAPAFNSPWRIEIGEDDNLYLADYSTNTGTLWLTDPNISAGSGVNVFVGNGTADSFANGHGRFGSSVIASGSVASANLTLYALEGDLSPINGLRQYAIGSGPLPFDATLASGAPNLANPLLQIANVTVDFDRAPDGKFYLLQNRFDGFQAGLYVASTNDADSDGLLDIVFNSLTATRAITGNDTNADFLRLSRAVKVSPDGTRAAIVRDDNNFWIINLTNGVPDLTARVLVTNAPTTTLGRDLCFDAAGNLYVVSSGQGLLRIFSPGGSSVAITGSDGTFSMASAVDQFVSVAATDESASEAGPDPGAFTVSRTGPTNAPLVVNFTLHGTASNGVDYATTALSATIAAGATDVAVVIAPLADSEPELTESAVLSLATGTNYAVQAPASATVFIADNNLPQISVTATDTNLYERVAADVGAFVLSRIGSTNDDLNVNFTVGGTASSGADYLTVPSFLVIPAGATNARLTVASTNDALVEGDEWVTLTIRSGSGYTTGANNTASVRLQDDDLPPVDPAYILFADDFDMDSAANWIRKFGANNLIEGASEDYDAVFAYDYSVDGLTPAPHSIGGTTRGLKVQVNKNDPTIEGSAGLNLYPTGQTFSGDFALRYDMYLSFGGTFTTEHALGGINHSGNLTNRVSQSADTNNTTAGGDGIWAAIVTDASGLIDYGVYTVTNADSLPTLLAERSASTLEGIFPSPPYGAAGSPSNSAESTNPPIWAEVELKHAGNLVTLIINNTQILQIANTTAYTNGNIMIGHNDQFNSVGSINNYVIFDNVRVVRLAAAPKITSVQLASGNVRINFSGANSDSASVFAVESSANVAAGFAADAGATIQQLGTGSFQATVPINGPMRFYRIKRQDGTAAGSIHERHAVESLARAASVPLRNAVG